MNVIAMTSEIVGPINRLPLIMFLIISVIGVVMAFRTKNHGPEWAVFAFLLILVSGIWFVLTPGRITCLEVIASDSKARGCIINDYDVVEKKGDTLWVRPR